MIDPPDEYWPMIREIFRTLVTSQGTRASADREELLSAFEQSAAAEEVLELLPMLGLKTKKHLLDQLISLLELDG